jgi:hypothetical protein
LTALSSIATSVSFLATIRAVVSSIAVEKTRESALTSPASLDSSIADQKITVNVSSILGIVNLNKENEGISIDISRLVNRNSVDVSSVL